MAGSVTASLSRQARQACLTLSRIQTPRYLVLSLTAGHWIEIDSACTGVDYGQLLCALPEDRCRWVVHTQHPARTVTLITWLPEHATIKERLLYTAVTGYLRTQLPDTALTVQVEDRAELACATLPDRSRAVEP